MSRACVSLAALLMGTALAAPQTFRVQEQLTSLNLATVESRTAVENFVGRTARVSGSLRFDTQARTGSGTVEVDGASIETGNRTRDGHMRSAAWLNFAALPTIRFQTTAVRWLQEDRYEVRGTLSMNGVTRPLNTTATVRLTPAGEANRGLGIGGDALAVSTRFNVKLSDYGVEHASVRSGRVSNDLVINLRLVASDR